mmetsp:Transcript_111585/g.221819  ORF Transcript_111585/g.221819 Transcript_111585/m.221819 type:complete len:114 (-) Transcript_111585:124-465(-)
MRKAPKVWLWRSDSERSKAIRMEDDAVAPKHLSLSLSRCRCKLPPSIGGALLLLHVWIILPENMKVAVFFLQVPHITQDCRQDTSPFKRRDGLCWPSKGSRDDVLAWAVPYMR